MKIRATSIVTIVLTLCIFINMINCQRIVRTKQPRATRGFKNTEMMTARGFGKRDGTRNGLENMWELIEGSPERTNIDDKIQDSIPLDWFVEELMNNPEFTRTVVRKFIDTNQDGMLSPDELLKGSNV